MSGSDGRERSYCGAEHQPCHGCLETVVRLSTLPRDIPVTPGGMDLRVGDGLRLTREPSLGTGPERDHAGKVLSAACIACAVPAVVARLRVRDPVWFDDGKIGGQVEALMEGDTHSHYACQTGRLDPASGPRHQPARAANSD